MRGVGLVVCLAAVGWALVASGGCKRRKPPPPKDCAPFVEVAAAREHADPRRRRALHDGCESVMSRDDVACAVEDPVCLERMLDRVRRVQRGQPNDWVPVMPREMVEPGWRPEDERMPSRLDRYGPDRAYREQVGRDRLIVPPPPPRRDDPWAP